MTAPPGRFAVRPASDAVREARTPMLGDKFRLRFEKAGVLRLLSHHDLMRVLERMLRRAGLPFKSTAGFHPGPRVVFAQSLPLGVVGRDEVVELELTEPRDADAVLAGLNEQAPDGLRFFRATAVPMKTTAMPRRIVYALPLPADRAGEVGEACDRLTAQAAVWVERVRPSPKGLNIRPYLRGVGVVRVNPGAAEASAGGPNPPGPPSLGGKGGDAPTDRPGESSASAVPQDATQREHPSPLRGGAGGEVDPASPPSSLATHRLTLDLWVTSTGTARADELLRLLGADDLLDAGFVLERSLVELRDEAGAPADPTDTPPDGPADTRPADPAFAARAATDQPAAASGVAVPGDLAVE